ncbi:DUF881 domain-containing protein [Clostridium sp. BJN0001]|uniref:DUF881 domain-containing protein n=1 Tax=Clostridium sp. BJN0001 TaxID=2930219 RepID=UPI001FD1D924|nr:DUF881 domain-containing protein [Clostridium sp. BJN0001]
MKKSKKNILILISAVVLGIMMVSNYSNDNDVAFKYLNASEYQGAIEKRANLYKEIDSLRESNKTIERQLNKYKKGDLKSSKILDEMQLQIDDYELFTGFKAVKGPGIIIEISDGDIDYNFDNIQEQQRKILHDNDMALVINELRKSGAEAISINDHRIVPWTGVICRWAFIQYQDGIMEYAPFKIYAIGNKDGLKASMLDDNSHLKNLIFRDLNVDIQESDNLEIPAYTGDYNSNNMEIDN